MTAAAVADAVAAMLRDGGFTGVFTFSPSALDEPEPTVCTAGAFVREARTDEGERGTVPVEVRVVRESPTEGGRRALAAEACVRQAPWDAYSPAGPFRLLGADTSLPAYLGTDGSGRGVWRFTATMTVARGF